MRVGVAQWEEMGLSESGMGLSERGLELSRRVVELSKRGWGSVWK